MAEVRDILMRIRGDSRQAVDALEKLNRSQRSLNDTLKDWKNEQSRASEVTKLLRREHGKLVAEQLRSQESLKKSRISLTELNQAVELGKNAFRGLANFAGAAFETLDQGRKVNQVTTSFETLQNQANLLASDSLEQLRQATRGLASDFELMQAANQAAALGINPDQFLEMAGAATVLGANLGQDVLVALEAVSSGVGRQSRLILDNIGVIIDAKTANENWASSNNRTVQSMTDLERKAAFVEEAVRLLNEKAERQPGILENAAVAAVRLSSSWKNASDQFAVGVTNSASLAAELNELNERIEPEEFRKLGESAAETASILIKALNPALTDQKELLTAATDLMGRAAEKAKELADATSKDLNFSLLRLFPVYSGIVDLAKEYNKGQKEAQEETKNTGKTMEELTQILENDLSAAWKKYHDDQAAAAKLSEEITKETNKLREELQKLKDTEAIEDLKEQLEAAARAGSSDEFKRISEKLKEKIAEGVIGGLDKAKTDPGAIQAAGEIGEIQGQKIADGIVEKEIEGRIKASEKIADKNRRDQEQAYRASVDFFEDILIGAVEGNISDVLENMLTRAAIKFGAEMLAQLTNAFSAELLFGGLGGIGGARGGGIGSIAGLGSLLGGSSTPVAGAGVGGSFAGAGGGLAGTGLLGLGGAGLIAGTGFAGLDFFNDVSNGRNANFASALALAPVTGGLSLFGLGGGAFGSGKSGDQRARDEVRALFQERGILDQNFGLSLFGGNSFNFGLDGGSGVQNFTGANSQFRGLGGALANASGAGGVQGVDALFASALASVEDYKLALLSAEGLFTQFGTTAAQQLDLVNQQFLAGGLSLEQYNERFSALEDVANFTISSIDDGLQLMARNVEGRPVDSLRLLEQTFTVVRDSGIQDTEALVATMQQRLGGDAGDVFRRMAEAGIDQFTDFSNLSAAQVRLLFNELVNLEDEFLSLTDIASNTGQVAADNLGRISEVLRTIISDAREAQDAIDKVSSGSFTVSGIVKGRATDPNSDAIGGGNLD